MARLWRGIRPRRRRLTLLVTSAAVILAAAIIATLALAPRPHAESSGSIGDPGDALVVYLGNSLTSGSPSDSGARSRFPYLVSSELGVGWIAITADGSGYSAPGSLFLRFGNLARQVPVGADVVVVVGSEDDARFGYRPVRFAADLTLAVIKEAAPDARLLIVATPWVNASAPHGILASRDAVRDAADAAGAVFLDPIAEGWWGGAGDGSVGADGLHPTDLGHAKLAERIAPFVRALLEQQRLEE
jgi:lysophospholipase L1-like esterase